MIYADPDDRTHPWLVQTADGRYVGWLHHRDVQRWPEAEVTVPIP